MKKTLLFLFVFASAFCFSQSQNVEELNTFFNKSIYNNLEVAHELASKSLKASKILNSDSLEQISYSNLSLVCFLQKKNDSSLVYTNKAIQLSLKLNNFEEQTILYNRLGALEQRNTKYSNALKYFLKSFKIAHKNSYKEQICNNHNSLALLYKQRGDKQKFYEELEKAIKLAKTNNYKNSLAKSYNIKGISFFGKENDSAIYYYNKSLALYKLSKNKLFEGIVNFNLGDLYINNEEYGKANIHLKASEAIAKEVSNLTSLYFVNLSLGIYNIETGNYSEGVRRYEIAVNDYKDYVDEQKLATGYWLLSEGYFLNNQLKKAYITQDNYISLNEKLFNLNKTKEFDKIRTKYEVEKKDNQIVLLEKDKELSATKRKWIIISAILLAIPLISLFLFYRDRAKTQEIIRVQEKEIHDKETARLQKEQELIQIKALVEGQDKERHRIAKELHDGVGGQLASVNLSLSEINSTLNNSELHNVGNLLSNSFSELRTLSHSLSSNYHEDKTLYSLLAELKKQYASNDLKIEISIYPENSLVDLDGAIKHNLYRVFQESFVNILKHANANNVQLSINKHTNDLVVIIEDDGIGFDVETIKKGIGMKNINERVKSINGKLSIDSSKNNGTQLIIEIPTETT